MEFADHDIKYNMEQHVFVIVDDGNCTWEEKARNVERTGAHALIIAEDSLEELENRWESMSDSKYDGSGTSIHVPTLLIDVKDAKKLI